MNLLQIPFSNWFKLEDDETAESYESNFRSSTKTLKALRLWIDHELSKLEYKMKLTYLEDKPNRAELLLTVVAKREQLLAMRDLLVIED